MFEIKDLFMKKLVLILSWVFILAAWMINGFGDSRLCGGNDLCLNSISTTVDLLFLICVPIALFSFFFLFLKNEIFRTWFYFTAIWVPLYLIVYFISSPSDGGGGWIMPNPSSRALTGFFGAVLYVIISLLIILIKSIQVYWKKK